MKMLKRDLQRKELINSLRANGMTFSNIGKVLNISRQRVHQLYNTIYTNKKSIWTYEKKLLYSKEKHQDMRAKAIKALGGMCAKCGMDDYRCLQIDHIHGGGCKELREVSSYTRYKKIVEDPDAAAKTYQVLCANHNWIKRFENDEL
jgi:hypothetical protein